MTAVTRNRVAEARRRAGLTQEELAERVGVSRVHIWRIENYERGATDKLKRQIAAALDVSPSTLFLVDATVTRKTPLETKRLEPSPA